MHFSFINKVGEKWDGKKLTTIKNMTQRLQGNGEFEKPTKVHTYTKKNTFTMSTSTTKCS